jgi:hypothetical protein
MSGALVGLRYPCCRLYSLYGSNDPVRVSTLVMVVFFCSGLKTQMSAVNWIDQSSEVHWTCEPRGECPMW